MPQEEKRVGYSATNSYLTMNDYTEATEYIWMVFHGIGYLSRYFITHFKGLDPQKNYLIAPQAPSKYYMDGDYRKVGASWLTRVDTAHEIENVMQYLNEVYRSEGQPPASKLIVLGFSQGVSIAMRWVARARISCLHLVLYAGGIPEELRPGDFDFLPETTKVTLVIGNEDKYLNGERRQKTLQKMSLLFKGKAEVLTFDGGHEIRSELLQTFIQ